MAKALRLLLAAFLCLALLTSCAPLNFQNVNELLRAPELGAGEGEMKKALAAALDGEPQYKFPKEGAWRSPLAIIDLDGDGLEEGILFYSLESNTTNADAGNNLYMAVMEQQENNWVLVAETQGTASDVASVEWADFFGDGTQQLIVGYSNSTLSSVGTKSLVFYQYRNGVIEGKTPPGRYYDYLVGDFAEDGNLSIAAVTDKPDSDGILRLQFYGGRDGAFEEIQSPVDLHDQMRACLGLYPTVGQDGKRMLIVDCRTQTDLVASQILRLSDSGEGFYAAENATDTVQATVRHSSLLTSRDIDRDGIAEIPVDSEQTLNTVSEDKALRWVSWSDFTVETPVEKEFGIMDQNLYFYVCLPEDWRYSAEVLDGEQRREWKVRRVLTGKVLLEVRKLETGEVPPENAQRIPGDENLYLIPGDNLPVLEARTVKMTSLA